MTPAYRRLGYDSLEEARAADYNLSPSQFVAVTDRATHRPRGDILADLAACAAISPGLH